MAVLKSKTNDGELKNQLLSEFKEIDNQLISLRNRKTEIRKQLLEIDIKPFKIGGYALAEVSCGRGKKLQKCLLECEEGMLYVRPVKDNGELSGRHFSIYPIDKDYSKHLKEVK